MKLQEMTSVTSQTVLKVKVVFSSPLVKEKDHASKNTGSVSFIFAQVNLLFKGIKVEMNIEI